MKVIFICTIILIALSNLSCDSKSVSKDITETPEYKQLLAENDSLKRLLDPDNPQSQEQNDKDQLLYNKRISIIEIKTGFNPYNNSEGLWLPCVAIKFKNVSKRDIKEMINISVIFIDNSSNEQIGTGNDFLALSNDYFLSGASKQCNFSSSIGWNGVNDQDVTAKIYFNDELIKTLKVDNMEFDGRIR